MRPTLPTRAALKAARRFSLAVAALTVAATEPLIAQQQTALPARDAALTGRPEPVLSLGVMDGDPRQQFASIPEVAFDADDNIYILDEGNHRVVVFDRTGRFVREMGRKGSGPGEFQLPVRLAITRDGHVVVGDILARSHSVFSPTGAFVRTVPLEGMLSPRAIHAHPRGGVALVRSPGPRIQGREQAEPNATVNWLRELRPDVQEARIASFPPSTSAPTATVSQSITSSGGEAREIRMPAPRAFAAPTLIGVLADGGVAYINSPRYEITLTDAEGRPARVMTRPIEPRRVTERDRQQARQRMAERLATGAGTRIIMMGPTGSSGGQAPPMPRAEIDQRVRAMEFEDVIPVVRQMAVDARGRLWVGRSSATSPDSIGAIDIIAPDGRYVGTVTGIAFPRAFSPSGLIAHIVRDDLDVPRVQVYRLPDGWR